jgi:hypothetical protein
VFVDDGHAPNLVFLHGRDNAIERIVHIDRNDRLRHAAFGGVRGRILSRRDDPAHDVPIGHHANRFIVRIHDWNLAAVVLGHHFCHLIQGRTR